MDFHIVIPARYQSSRFPGKLLELLNGKTIIEHVYHQAKSTAAQSITIATDDDRIFNVAKSFGADVMMTAKHHPSGTDRLAEVVQQDYFSDNDIIVNVQGDEPLIAPALIHQVATLVANSPAPVATLAWPIDSLAQFQNPNTVKVVLNHNGQALYFSRAQIPYSRDNNQQFSQGLKHIGLYAYRVGFLRQWSELPESPLENTECLEQLRILQAGHTIQVAIAKEAPKQDINTLEDLEVLRNYINNMAS